MIAKNEKMSPKISAHLPILRKFNPSCSEIGDEKKPWEHFRNHLIHFLIFGFGIVSSDTSIQEFLLLYFLCIFSQMK